MEKLMGFETCIVITRAILKLYTRIKLFMKIDHFITEFTDVWLRFGLIAIVTIERTKKFVLFSYEI